jgi:magnesium chelatase subunit H
MNGVSRTFQKPQNPVLIFYFQSATMMKGIRILLLYLSIVLLGEGFLLPVPQQAKREDGCCGISRHHDAAAHSAVRTTTSMIPPARLRATTLASPTDDVTVEEKKKRLIRRRTRIVLVAGFESFNRDLYQRAAATLLDDDDWPVDLQVFADSDIRRPFVGAAANAGATDDSSLNPVFASAVRQADAFVASLIFDYDDVLAVKSLLSKVTGPRLIFESATELMEFNRVGSFSMAPNQDGTVSGPPPVIKAILSKFGSGKEEDKLTGYLKLLKVGPDLLKYVPGEKAGDLRAWLEAYRYWNQGGAANFAGMLRVIRQQVVKGQSDQVVQQQQQQQLLPELQVTPDIGLLHPLRDRHCSTSNNRFFLSPAEYMTWRMTDATYELAQSNDFALAPRHAPRVAVLLYRKHVITELRYIDDLLTQMEAEGIIPVPIFINGVEAHTIVRDLLTSHPEMDGVQTRRITRDGTYQPAQAVVVDAIVNTIGFPLVGGPAGSMAAGRNLAVAEQLLGDMDVPYLVASPLLLQTIPQWKKSGVLGLQSVVLYSLPELDGAIDTMVLGGLVGDKIALVPERVRKLNKRVKQWVELRRTPPSERRIAISLYGFPPVRSQFVFIFLSKCVSNNRAGHTTSECWSSGHGRLVGCPEIARRAFGSFGPGRLQCGQLGSRSPCVRREFSGGARRFM